MPNALIVDDDLSIRTTMRSIPENVKFDVDEAENGEIALQILKRNKYNIVILDIHMPKMDGLQVMSVLKKRKQSIPVIVISANLSDENLEKLIQLGVKEFLSKPFDIKTLYQAVNKICPLEEKIN